MNSTSKNQGSPLKGTQTSPVNKRPAIPAGFRPRDSFVSAAYTKSVKTAIVLEQLPERCMDSNKRRRRF